jgi:hypothetical protein
VAVFEANLASTNEMKKATMIRGVERGRRACGNGKLYWTEWLCPNPAWQLCLPLPVPALIDRDESVRHIIGPTTNADRLTN